MNYTRLFKIAPLVLLFLPLIIFFYPVWLQKKMPIPADTIVGLYHPYRDVVWNGYNAGVPFKNFLITDAVRQQYPWRTLAIDSLKQGRLPLWNPYTHAGTPLLANIQAATFYPLNLLFGLLPFNSAWTIQVMVQLFMLSLFTYWFLIEIGRSKKAAVLSGIVVGLSGFSVAWLEWNTTLHTLVWLPLALLSLEKVKQKKEKWFFVLSFSLLCILFAGFLQTAFYALLCMTSYGLLLFVKSKSMQNRRFIILLSITLIITAGISLIQLFPTLKLISDSARSIDQGNVLLREDWFLPWQNLVMFITPDFFGNPSTLNYWGIFNYTEFIGYIGIVPLALSFAALFTKSTRSDWRKWFFIFTLLISLLFATSNPVSKLPFILNLPLLSTAQPSRLMMIIDFSLAILVAFGTDKVLSIIIQKKEKHFQKILMFSFFIVLLLICMWNFSRLGQQFGIEITTTEKNIIQRNLVVPSVIAVSFVTVVFLLNSLLKMKKLDNRQVYALFFGFVLLLTSADLLRFAWKFTPFTNPDFLYPDTQLINYLKQDNTQWRYMTLDRRIFPPNFNMIYGFQTIEGYDPIYLRRYGQLIATMMEDRPVVESYEFHRIIRPENYESPIVDLLNVKYLLSLSEIEDPTFVKVFQEGETRLYENQEVFPRTFVIDASQVNLDEREDLASALQLNKERIRQTAKITSYNTEKVTIAVDDPMGGVLVLSDSYADGWKAFIDESEVTVIPIFYALRGIMIPSGTHEVVFRYSQL